MTKGKYPSFCKVKIHIKNYSKETGLFNSFSGTPKNIHEIDETKEHLTVTVSHPLIMSAGVVGETSSANGFGPLSTNLETATNLNF